MLRELKRNASNVLVPTATYLQGLRGSECRRDDTQTETDGQGHTFGKTRWYVYDGLGSVVGEVDVNGNLTSSPKYDVYGLVRSNAGTASSAMGFVGGLGHLSEANTGLIYMRARYYDPSVGRFISEDSAKSGDNWFTYCGNNPVNEVDRTGNAGERLILAILMEMLGMTIGSLNNTPAVPAALQPYINAINSIDEMIATNMLRIEMVTAVGATADKGGAYKRAYNAAGYGAIGVMAACGIYQMSLIAQMIETDKDSNGKSIY